MSTDQRTQAKAGDDVVGKFIVGALGLFVALGLFISFSTLAQDYPSRPVRLVVAVGAGGTPDIIARLLAPRMSESLGKAVFVENKPGADQIIAMEYVVGQPADGYVIVLLALDVVANMAVTRKGLRFDPLKDVPPFTGVAEAKWVLGSSARLPWRSFGDFVDSVKANPGKFNYGYTSTATGILTEAILRHKGLVATSIPYISGSGGQAVRNQALLNGTDIQFGLMPESFAVTMGEGVRRLAATGLQRSPQLPGVPTFSELGYPNMPGLFYALNARTGTPRPVLEKLGAAVSRALQHPEIKAPFAKFYLEIPELGPQAAAQALAERAKLFSDVAKQMKIQVQ